MNTKTSTKKKIAKKPTPTDASAAFLASSAAPLLTLPPTSANIPVVPLGATSPVGNLRGTSPQADELKVLLQAITDLGNFSAYATTLGASVPPQSQVSATWTAASDWSSMRQKTAAWNGYCQMQEGLSWTAVRAQLTILAPAFNLALAADPTIATQFPSLTAFINLKKAIANRAAATRAANKEAAATGRPATHGVVGKARKAAAAKAALLAQTTAASNAATGTPTPAAGSASPPSTAVPGANASPPLHS